MNVKTLCTTEDPTDTLEHHIQLAKEEKEIQVSTAFRPDRAVLIDSEGYNAYIDTLEEATGIEIRSFSDLRQALENRIDHFHQRGCRLSDHGLAALPFLDHTEAEIQQIFIKKRNGF